LNLSVQWKHDICTGRIREFRNIGKGKTGGLSRLCTLLPTRP
jgi:hypothetical protein